MGRAPQVALLVAGLAALGEAGHVVLQRLGWAATHHVFHVAYLIGAAAGFLWLAARDVRRHGAPRFSWSLRPQGGPGRGPQVPARGIVGLWIPRPPRSSPR